MLITGENNKFILNSLNSLYSNLNRDVSQHWGVFSSMQEEGVSTAALKENFIKVVQLIQFELEKWEKEKIEAMQGVTPGEYIGEIRSTEQLLEFLKGFGENLPDYYPPSLHAKIRELAKEDFERINSWVKDIEPDESKHLPQESRILLSITFHSGDAGYLPNVVDVMFKFSLGETSIKEYEFVQEIIKALVGDDEEARGYLLSRCEGPEREESQSDEFSRKMCIIALAMVPASQRDDAVFQFIKSSFRKSSFKLMEAMAFRELGDGRAVLPLRGYLKKECQDVAYLEYKILRDIVIGLGGQVEDIDGEYGYAIKQHEYEHAANHHHHHHHEDCGCDHHAH